jgi:hypothetical protein
MEWSDEELSILMSKYGKEKLSNWSHSLKRSHSSIRWKANSLGLKADRSITNKTTEFNDRFFSLPDPLNCYIAGLIAADGCVCTKKKCVWFYQKRIEFVEYVRDSLSANNTIYFRKREKTEEHSILFSSDLIVKDLFVNFGITDNKSRNGLPRPNISYELAPFYVAGLIDGDGSISRTEESLNFTLLCSEEVLSWINLSMNTDMCFYKRQDCNTELFRMTGYGNRARDFLFPILDKLLDQKIFISHKWKKVSDEKTHYAMSSE